MFVSEGEGTIDTTVEEQNNEEEEEGKSVSSEGSYDAYYGFKEIVKDCGKSDGGV